MADSDNTMTLPFVARKTGAVRSASAIDESPAETEIRSESDPSADPAVAAAKMPTILAASHNEPELHPAALRDPALLLVSDWRRARYISMLLCRVQQRLESQVMVNPGIQGLTTDLRTRVQNQTVRALGDPHEYAVAREAEVFAMTEALKLQDSIPEVAATSLIGVIAKLEMVVGADRDIGDPTDFPWPHIASVLRDLKAIAGGLPVGRRSRERTRSDVAKHWESAVKLVAALKAEG
ncbi:hypothetical protein FJ970_10505 [Mesorhizobium sp. B2-1-8]|uniref:hypothetical protein n=1 Tax=Mesorhizobium sp. B2-1-8 TaxID=2589967 RepID=UPI001D1028CA|nr:hypothetical protein [Mesorhizobium sp. B2-1-8]UCI21351.1 hypothetical protein FJ970_10505 [Mesorhizobium sp. B2-1-8]